MTWTQRLKRVFNIEIVVCARCGGSIGVIACIEDPVVIEKILSHLNLHTPAEQAPSPNGRAPPQTALFEWPDGARNTKKMPLPTQRGRASLGPSAEHGGFRPE